MSGYDNARIAAELKQALAPLDIVPIEEELRDEPALGGLRRARRLREEDPVAVLSLLDIDGVLIWEDGAVTASTSRTRRRGGMAVEGEVVTQLKFSKELGANDIARKLEQLDQRLTPQGPARLLAWDPKQWQSSELAEPVSADSALLLIHGTFSNSQNMMDEFQSTDEGVAFLRKAAKYDRVLSFDHFTLSRSPWINALDLARLLEPHQFKTLDVICHSRGGLVTRWWLELVNRKELKATRAIFVGCPLHGTSLADPQSLRHGLNLLTNIGKFLGEACRLIPMLTAAGGLMQIVSSIGGFAAKAPLVDAAIAMIPGLAAMSRTQTNFELDALNQGNPAARAGYSAVLSDFEPDPDIGWRFWRLFNLDRLSNAAGDYLVFNQANDLVVDTESMTFHAFGPTPALGNRDAFCCFSKSSKVFHTNYFRSPETLEFLAARLGI